MTQQPYKICPRCQTPAALTTPVCAQCGRQYRTQFAPPDQPEAFVAPPATQQLPPATQAPAGYDPYVPPPVAQQPYPPQMPYQPQQAYPPQMPYQPQQPYPPQAPYQQQQPFPQQLPYQQQQPYPPQMPYQQSAIPPAAPPPGAISFYPSTHSPGWALVCFFLFWPLAGQFYNRQFAKGLVLLGLFFLTIFVTNGLAGLLLFPFCLFDCYAIAKRMHDGEAVGPWAWGAGQNAAASRGAWRATVYTFLIVAVMAITVVMWGGASMARHREAIRHRRAASTASDAPAQPSAPLSGTEPSDTAPSDPPSPPAAPADSSYVPTYDSLQPHVTPSEVHHTEAQQAQSQPAEARQPESTRPAESERSRSRSRHLR